MQLQKQMLLGLRWTVVLSSHGHTYSLLAHHHHQLSYLSVFAIASAPQTQLDL